MNNHFRDHFRTWCVSEGRNSFFYCFTNIGVQPNATLLSTTENLMICFVLGLDVGEASCRFKSRNWYGLKWERLKELQIVPRSNSWSLRCTKLAFHYTCTPEVGQVSSLLLSSWNHVLSHCYINFQALSETQKQSHYIKMIIFFTLWSLVTEFIKAKQMHFATDIKCMGSLIFIHVYHTLQSGFVVYIGSKWHSIVFLRVFPWHIAVISNFSSNVRQLLD